MSVHTLVFRMLRSTSFNVVWTLFLEQRRSEQRRSSIQPYHSTRSETKVHWPATTAKWKQWHKCYTIRWPAPRVGIYPNPPRQKTRQELGLKTRPPVTTPTYIRRHIYVVVYTIIARTEERHSQWNYCKPATYLADLPRSDFTRRGRAEGDWLGDPRWP